jgi:hypothetical protein
MRGHMGARFGSRNFSRAQAWQATVNPRDLSPQYPDDVEVPSFAAKVVCAKCGARGRHIDVRPNWKEQPPSESLTGKQWR